MNQKRRILFIGEASYLATGFGTYWHEVIKRLYATGKFEIAELGSYGKDTDPQIQQVPWKFYPVQPDPNNKKALAQFNSCRTNQFGEWRFDSVCLDFKSDIVCAIRDFWMDEFLLRSPFRNKYSLIWMPTIDGVPQKENWLDSYKLCDSVLTYSDWGYGVLKNDGRKGMNLLTVASPGADTDVFKPAEDKREHKKRLGIDPDSIIIGTVMRNQKRKLYYDLIEAFAMWINKSKNKGHIDLGKKTFLYLHTSYPDQGWNIGNAIKEFSMGNKVIMTYLCGNCKTAFPSFFSEETTYCPKCNKLSAHPPNANHHCPRSVLADIMKTFDLYVQYSVCLHPDTPIMTSDGWEDVGNIKVGDRVVGRDGELHKVYKTVSSKPDMCFDLSVKSRIWSLTATNNHPWLTVERTGLSMGIESIINRERDKKKRGTECPKLDFIYKRTDQLEPGDLLATRIPTEEILPDYDLPFMDEDMAYYLGLFAADGYSNPKNGTCQITLSDKDVINPVLIKKIAKRLCKDAKTYQYSGRKAIDVCIHNNMFRGQLRSLLYNKDRTKQLPYGCHLWPKNLQRKLVEGLMSGDGHWLRENLNIYATTSVHIAKMVGSIFERLGWYYCSFVQYRDNRLPMYRFEVRTDGLRKSHETLYRDGFAITKVASCGQSDFDDDVVSIDVEGDHNYNTICGISHNCEGFGMPIVEALSCGVPIAAVRYSAMEDHLRCPGSIPIEVGRYFRECVTETEQRRALPDNQDFCNKLDKFIKSSAEQKSEMCKQARRYVMEEMETYGSEKKYPRHSWDRTAAIWEHVLETCEIHNPEDTWLRKDPQIKTINLAMPKENMNNSEFVRWVINDVWQHSEMSDTNFAGEWIRSLNMGVLREDANVRPMDRKKMIEHFIKLVEHENEVERRRVHGVSKESSDKVGSMVI